MFKGTIFSNVFLDNQFFSLPNVQNIFKLYPVNMNSLNVC